MQDKCALPAFHRSTLKDRQHNRDCAVRVRRRPTGFHFYPQLKVNRRFKHFLHSLRASIPMVLILAPLLPITISSALHAQRESNR